MPAAKKTNRLERAKTRGTTPKTPGTARIVRDAAYADAYSNMTIAAAKEVNRRIGTTKWYRLNKDALVAIIVLNKFADKIQAFFKDRVMMHHERVCPISLVPMSEIPSNCRFKHSNAWFNKELLALHMSRSSDFVNPVTRVEFREEDVLEIDPELIEKFRNREELRSSLTEDLAIIQSVENELEDVFQCMVEAAQQIRSRMEFTIVFDSLSEDFQECHNDLIGLDNDRSKLTLKSLGDVIRGDPNCPVRMSRKREGILTHFLQCQS